MIARATLPYVEVESTLGVVLARLAGSDELPLSIQYGDRVIQAGYHITEVKAGSFVTLDCGGNPDAWQETVLQVEDIPAKDDRLEMTAGKFRSILAQVEKKVRLDHDARLTIEIGRPGEAMQVFDIGEARWAFEPLSVNRVIVQSRMQRRHHAARPPARPVGAVKADVGALNSAGSVRF